MNEIVNPVLFYLAIALGGVGVFLALPRRGISPQAFGAIVALTGLGLAVVLMGVRGAAHLPNLYFYVFSGIALGAALRVITHPKPVYAALYFILTVIASAGLFLILSAEFMAFALIIVYAGAILITYLFVIMLATQAPTEDHVEPLADYDVYAREPVVATGVGFVLLGAITALVFSGVGSLPEPAPAAAGGDRALASMPRRIERALEPLLEPGERLARNPDGSLQMNVARRSALAVHGTGTNKLAREVVWPESLQARNVEEVGFNLLRDHPGTIEIAGVILLMAMLGAVVLSRKQVQLDEEAKASQARTLEALPGPEGAS